MGFYIRKGFNFGPLRLNLSKSGLGVSVGVKGARVGMGPRGSYVHAGRGGLYFRQHLGGTPRQGAGSNVTPQPPGTLEGNIESAPAAVLTSVSQAALVEALDNVRRRVPRVPLVVGGALVLVAIGAVLAATETVDLSPLIWTGMALLLLGLAVFATIRARESDERDGSIALNYNLDAESHRRFMDLHEGLQGVAACAMVWSVDSEHPADDWKRNAGAHALVRRILVQPVQELPKRLECNVPVMCLPAGRQKLYFFPNGMFVYGRAGVGVVSYQDLRAESGLVSFREENAPPSDAPVLGTTWRYVNKNGGPDRRFNYNTEIPILQYGSLTLTSGGGVNELFHTSNPSTVEPVRRALDALRAVLSEAPSGARSQGAETHGATSQRKPANAWDVLGVQPGASAAEISTAYHRAAQMYHPDKMAGLASEFTELAERRMKEVNAAYEEVKRQSK